MATFRTDGVPAGIADDAAEAIRALNHATLKPPSTEPGWGGVVDVYRMLTGLAVMARRLPQSLDQAAGAVRGEAEAGRIVMDVGSRFEGRPDAAAEAAIAALQDASLYASGLTHALDVAVQTLAAAAIPAQVEA